MDKLADFSVLLKIKKSIDSLSLKLDNKIVLTEAATGPYAVTSIIAALAGATVFAFTKNTRYGSVAEVEAQTLSLAKALGVEERIQVITELTPEIISSVDIITNSGHLRPITRNILSHTKKGVLIAYMYEKWEYREGDLDLEYCRNNEINIICTNERHPKIDVFNYLGELAVKQLHNAGKWIYGNKFIIISNNDFGPFLAKTLSRLALRVGVFDIVDRKPDYHDNIEWLGEFPNTQIPANYLDAEAIIFTAYPFNFKWFSDKHFVDISSIKSMNSPVIIRFAGDVDTDSLTQNGIGFYPEHVPSGHMGILLSEIGWDAIIKLQAGGLKAAELGLLNQLDFDNHKIGVWL